MRKSFGVDTLATGLATLAAMVLAFLLATSLGGCAARKGADLTAQGQATGQSWGRTALVCRTVFDEQLKATGAEEEREKMAVKRAKALELTASALKERPDVVLLDAQSLRGRLPAVDPQGLGDQELARLAAASGADTVVLVQVLEYGGDLTVSLLPPYWQVSVRYAYHARAIDARSGALRLDAQRSRTSGKLFALVGRGALEAAFWDDLRELFGASPVNKS
jgi:hypothetical protein